VSGVRDYLTWHELYDDPGSSLPRRLALVREVLGPDSKPGGPHLSQDPGVTNVSAEYI
jgi:hypothetical protein